MLNQKNKITNFSYTQVSRGFYVSASLSFRYVSLCYLIDFWLNLFPMIVYFQLKFLPSSFKKSVSELHR